MCPKKAYYQFGSLVCDVYFEPEVVWEIKCADLSISPAHMAAAGLVDEVKVIFLVFFYVKNYYRAFRYDSHALFVFEMTKRLKRRRTASKLPTCIAHKDQVQSWKQIFRNLEFLNRIKGRFRK